MSQISSHGRWLDIARQEIHLYDDHGNDDLVEGRDGDVGQQIVCGGKIMLSGI